MQLSLEQLKPKEADFTLSEHAGKSFRLRKFSLRERIWVKNRFGDRVKDIFETQSIPEIAELAHYLLKDASEFPSFEKFCESICTVQDQVNLVKALLQTIGIDDAVIRQLAEKLPKAEAPNPTTP